MGQFCSRCYAGFYSGVVVFNIDPTYYAAGNYKGRVVLSGVNFDMIPSDAIAMASTSNENPLQLRYYTSDNSYIFTMISKTDNEIVFEQDGIHSHSTGMYLGAILSPDRNVVYWINETRPMP